MDSVSIIQSGVPGGNMSPTIHPLSFDGTLLQRGFWLYVWEVVAGDGRALYYVGRTGDSSSANAQSPFSRVTQHLGRNPHSNALRCHLEKADVVPEECRSFRLFPYGPIFPETGDHTEHRRSRDIVAALEQALANALSMAGYNVLNSVVCRKPLDRDRFEQVRRAFATEFVKLRDREGEQ